MVELKLFLFSSVEMKFCSSTKIKGEWNWIGVLTDGMERFKTSCV